MRCTCRLSRMAELVDAGIVAKDWKDDDDGDLFQ